jgi:hypothetical protein
VFFSDGLNENQGNVVDVDFALMCKLLEFGIVGDIPPCCSFGRSGDSWHIV